MSERHIFLVNRSTQEIMLTNVGVSWPSRAIAQRCVIIVACPRPPPRSAVRNSRRAGVWGVEYCLPQLCTCVLPHLPRHNKQRGVFTIRVDRTA